MRVRAGLIGGRRGGKYPFEGEGILARRGFYCGPDRFRLSCHVNGYKQGSQFALRVGDDWYGWWSDGGWQRRRQKPVHLTIRWGPTTLYDDFLGDAPARDCTIVLKEDV